MNAFSFSAIDLQTIGDGTYQGSCDATLVQVDVQVKVANHNITAIDLLRHQNGLGKEAETMLEDMLESNTSDVDMISGATLSSKTIRCAVEHAFLGK